MRIRAMSLVISMAAGALADMRRLSFCFNHAIKAALYVNVNCNFGDVLILGPGQGPASKEGKEGNKGCGC
jgi:hypothetical protein